MTKQMKALQLGIAAQAFQMGVMLMTPPCGEQFAKGFVGYKIVNYMWNVSYNNPF